MTSRYDPVCMHFCLIGCNTVQAHRALRLDLTLHACCILDLANHQQSQHPQDAASSHQAEDEAEEDAESDNAAPPGKGYDDVDTETEESKSTHRPPQLGRARAQVIDDVACLHLFIFYACRVCVAARLICVVAL